MVLQHFDPTICTRGIPRSYTQPATVIAPDRNKPMPPLTKVLFLEMDAAERSLVRQWAAAGLMPNVQRLLARGIVGPTLAPEGFFIGAIWPSLTTGVSPARHGVHSWEQLKPGTYEFFRNITPRYIKRAPFWNALSDAGKRVAVFDIPLSGVSEGLNGIQSVEWGAHDANIGFTTWPPQLKDEVLAKFGAAPAKSCDGPKTAEQMAAFRDGLVRSVEAKADLTCHYLSQGGWDFFAQVFTESHCAGHQAWHLQDKTSPHYDPAVAGIVGNPMQDVYVAIDTAIGRVLKLVGDDTVVVFLLGHGMGPSYGAYYLFPDILLRLGVSKPVVKKALAAPARTTRRITDTALSAVWRALPQQMKNSLSTVRNGLRDWIDYDPGYERPGGPRHIDHGASQCFMIDNNHATSAIRLNLVGREPSGVLNPGAEADAFCAQLSRDLLAIMDIDRNVPAFTSVTRVADLYRGEHQDTLPDLLVQWNHAIPVGKARLSSPKLGVLEGQYRLSRTGEHRPEGLFAAFGGGLEPRLLNRTVSVMDFAPTFAGLLGVELKDIDGQPIAEVLGRVEA
jgi:predicted AlkP superfamily phosphohydrolase/phosphomutase